MPLSLTFVAGTLELRGLAADAPAPAGCLWDARAACHRAPAIAYAELIRALIRSKLAHDDQARAYPTLEHGMRVRRAPRPYQTEALAAWQAQRCRGVGGLSHGAGKSQLACMASEAKRRATLVVAPTLDLVRQWYDLLRTTFGVAIGVVGGGDHDVQPLTVTTYASAYLHREHPGARCGLIVFDECHHLPGASYALAARAALAPFRLGLTATPDREAALDELIGAVAYRKEITDLAGDFLAEYDV